MGESLRRHRRVLRSSRPLRGRRIVEYDDQAVLRRARGMRNDVTLLLKLKWAAARQIRLSKDLARFLHLRCCTQIGEDRQFQRGLEQVVLSRDGPRDRGGDVCHGRSDTVGTLRHTVANGHRPNTTKYRGRRASSLISASSQPTVCQGVRSCEPPPVVAPEPLTPSARPHSPCFGGRAVCRE